MLVIRNLYAFRPQNIVRFIRHPKTNINTMQGADIAPFVVKRQVCARACVCVCLYVCVRLANDKFTYQRIQQVNAKVSRSTSISGAGVVIFQRSWRNCLIVRAQTVILIRVQILAGFAIVQFNRPVPT